MQLEYTDYTPSLVLSNTQFLIAIFGDQWVNSHVTCFIDDPAAINNQRRNVCWAGDYYRNYYLQPNTNQYFTVSVFSPDEAGRSRRRKGHFIAQFCIVLDDVDEKLSPEQADKLPRPSWKLRTSKGSEQWGYILNEPCTDRAKLDNLTDGLIASDLAPDSTDPGMRGVTRYMRLPEGVNTKASKQTSSGQKYCCRILYWQPHLNYTIEQLALPFSIDLDAPRNDVNDEMDNAVEITDHPIFNVLNVKSNYGGGKLEITCPWLDEHTGTKDNDGTVIYTNDNGLVGFKCHHGHCEHRTGGHLLKKLFQDFPEFKTRYERWKVLRQYLDVEILFPSLNQPTNSVDTLVISQQDESGLIELLAALPHPELIKANVIQTAWLFCFESGSNNKINILKADGTHYSQPKTCGHAMLKAAFGGFVDEGLALEYFTNKAAIKNTEKALGDYQKQVVHLFFTYLTKHKQINSIQYEIDLYTDESRLEMKRDRVNLITGFVPFEVANRVEAAVMQLIVDDYLTHFPNFMDYLESVAAARFAPDRRHAGVWIHAGSGWGKSFLMQIFKNIDIVTPLTETQVKTCCSGSPVGLSPDRFLNAWIVEFEEFRTVNADMKRINNTMMLSPKNQLTAEVNIYNKTFLSAEVVSSLLGEYGVENQFSERIAYMPVGNAKLDQRPLFNDDKVVYLNALTTFVSDYLNKHVQNMREIGRSAAEKGASRVVKSFHDRYHFNHHHAGIAEGIDEIILDIQDLILKLADPVAVLTDGESALKRQLNPSFIVGEHAELGPISLLKRPYKFIENYINNQVSKSECASIQLKKYTILSSIDPNWQSTRRVKLANGKISVQRGVLVELSGTEVVDFM